MPLVQCHRERWPAIRSVLTTKPYWHKQFDSIGNWSVWLAEGDEPERLEVLRRNVEKGLPCGSEKFIQKPEKLIEVTH